MNHSNDATVEDRHVGDVAQVTIPTHFLGFDDVLTFTRVDSQVTLVSGIYNGCNLFGVGCVRYKLMYIVKKCWRIRERNF